MGTTFGRLSCLGGCVLCLCVVGNFSVFEARQESGKTRTYVEYRNRSFLEREMAFVRRSQLVSLS